VAAMKQRGRELKCRINSALQVSVWVRNGRIGVRNLAGHEGMSSPKCRTTAKKNEQRFGRG
jgi:predicted  nucleic acid-binding Zn ribbon protein